MTERNCDTRTKRYLMFAGGTILFDLFQSVDDLLEIISNGAVDSFAVLFKECIERNGISSTSNFLIFFSYSRILEVI